MYRMHRIFCATGWETEGERRTFYDVVGQFNETNGIPAGALYVPVSLGNIHDKRPYQYTVEENIRECRHYLLVLGDNWGPPERNFERDYKLALACAADEGLPMRQVVMLLRMEPDGSPPPFAATLDAAGVKYTLFHGIDDFRQALLRLFAEWLPGDAGA
jgi:hypothetical protein